LAVEVIHLVTRIDKLQSEPQISFTILQLQILTAEALARINPQPPEATLMKLKEDLRRCFMVAHKEEQLVADEIGKPIPFHIEFSF
jgi:hypothetical protein